MGKHDGGITAPEQRKPFGALLEDGMEVFGFLRTFLPGVDVCLSGQACTYDLSFNQDFIINTLPEHDNVLMISGLSGHGFKFASALDEIATAFAEERDSGFDLSPFLLRRFAA